MTATRFYAWQSQQQDGSWSVIAMGFVDAKDIPVGAGPRYVDSKMSLVLVHRSVEAVMSDLFIAAAQAHQLQYKQPLRVARFELAQVIDSHDPDHPIV